MEFAEYDELVTGIVALFKKFIPDEKWDEEDVAWYVAKMGAKETIWFLDDLHIGFDFSRGKIRVNTVKEFPNYAKKKVQLFWETLKEVEDVI